MWPKGREVGLQCMIAYRCSCVLLKMGRCSCRGVNVNTSPGNIITPDVVCAQLVHDSLSEHADSPLPSVCSVPTDVALAHSLGPSWLSSWCQNNLDTLSPFLLSWSASLFRHMGWFYSVLVWQAVYGDCGLGPISTPASLDLKLESERQEFPIT